MSYRRVVRCKPREGLQAALQLGYEVHCIMSNGLVISFFHSAQEDFFNDQYNYICDDGRRQWSIKQWNNRGYELVSKTQNGYQRSRVTPKLIVSQSTVSSTLTSKST